MKAVKAKAAVPTPKAKDAEGEAKVKDLDLHLAKEGGGTRPQRRLLTPRPSPQPDPQTRKARPPRNLQLLSKANAAITVASIYGHQSRDCRKRIYAKSKKTQRQTNNSVTATQVTFDADEDDLTGSEPDDETATLFQSGLTVDSDNEAQYSMAIDSDTHTDDANNTGSDDETDDDEEREYYTEFIDSVRYLNYRVVVPPDGPPAPLSLAQQDNSGNANEPHSNPTQPDSRWGSLPRPVLFCTASTVAVHVVFKNV
jgi:hypothetical protein